MVGRDGGLARQKNPRFIPEVWRSRWAFMKRASKLSHRDADGLELVFETLPEVGIAWMLKEQFAVIYDAPDRVEAERRLELWLDLVTVAGIPEFINTWRTFSIGASRSSTTSMTGSPTLSRRASPTGSRS